jgi:hypothetical protein
MMDHRARLCRDTRDDIKRVNYLDIINLRDDKSVSIATRYFYAFL